MGSPKRTALVVLASLALALAIWALFFRSSDEQRVRAALDRLASAAAVERGENPALRAARVRATLIDVVAPDVSFDVAEAAAIGRGREALVTAALSAPGAWEEAEVSFRSLRITFEERSGPKRARAEGTATLVATRAGGAKERDERRIAVQLEERDGAFRVVELTVWPREGS